MRIDDLDSARVRPEYIENIFYQLEKLGLDWDIGPSGPGDFYRNWSQLNRFENYQKILENLKQTEQLFACDCSRKTLVTSEKYSGKCLNRGLDFNAENVSWRIKTEITGNINYWEKEIKMSGELSKNMSEFIVLRRDKIPAYQIASLADDLHFGITHVVRGADLRDSTLAQLYIAHLLELKNFSDIRFWHHDLMKDDSGEKISKSTKTSMDAEDLKTADVIMEFAVWMGWKKGEFLKLSDLPEFR